ncbi:hypothetical protein L3V65_13750 [Heyndrickxia coagulans]|uniref:hypothetical protein n=2 Tax=Heyndrickxia TaxID=2837504 RepID=UPI001F2EAAE1|nr:hypothetical protein [Heyndrickxia coagulans]UJZ87267.1 hypothetical protein L3V65_13750 [Heyndrickxia coagulans]
MPASAETSQDQIAQVKLIRVLKYHVDPKNVTNEILQMYTADGWTYDGNEFIKKVTYPDDKIKVDGKELTPNESGTFEIHIDGDSAEKTIGVKNDGVNYEDRTVNLQKNQVIIIESVIDVNLLQNNMDAQMNYEDTNRSSNDSPATTNDFNGSSSDSDNSSDDSYDSSSSSQANASNDNSGTTSLGQKNGDLPHKGDIVACNRFNGYQGNGRYYSNESSKQALKNFYQSDCSEALVLSSQCLRDHGPAKLRYCSLVSSSHYGKCSKITNHSTRYHKHTSFYGPSGK